MRSDLGLASAGLAALLVLALAPNAHASILVANDGVDGPTCGGKKAPCRSIGRGIANAGVGEKIIVGPGHYGDLDGDGTLGEAGEEEVSEACGSVQGRSVVCIDKPVTILSRDGAASTVIEARMADQDYTVVMTAPGATLGAPKKGFTILGGEALGVRSPLLLFGGGITASGNRCSGRSGVAVSGSGHVFRANQLRGIPLSTDGSAHRIVGNEISDTSGVGLSVFRCRACRVANNLVTRAGTDGIQIAVDDSIHIGDTNVIEGNVVSASGRHGFGTFRIVPVANVVFRGNVASRNAGAGFQLDGSNLTVRGNVALGNGVAGVQIDPLSDPPLLLENDFIANGAGEGTLCGVRNLSPQPVAATQSYWGAASGPGPRPADDACSGPGAGVVATEPFAKKPHKVKPKLPRIE